MIDLSNNNGTGHDFAKAFAAGHRRLYLKASEGTRFRDPDFETNMRAALKAGFRVGAYHFAHPCNDPAREAALFVACAAPLYENYYKRLLVPALDLEYGRPTASIAAWAAEFHAQAHYGALLIYGNAYYLEASGFTHPPGPLWLAAYGRNNGKEYPFRVPKPWAKAAAHQYTANGLVPGIRGRVDVSRVLDAKAIDL